MLERPLQASKSSFRSTAARVAKVGHGQCAKEIVRLGALCKGLFEDVSELIQLISWRLGLPIHKEVSKSLQGVGSVRDNRHALEVGDRKSTRLNSSHLVISYAVFCLKK